MNKKRKILLVGWYFYPKVGGAETVMLNQAKWLVENGYEVYVLSSNSGDQKAEEKYLGITIIRKSYMFPNIEYNQQEVKEEFCLILDRINPDIIHFHNSSLPLPSLRIPTTPKKSLSMLNESKKRKIPVIEHAHNAQLRTPEHTKELLKYQYDYLFCVSNFVKKKWQKLGAKAKKYKVIYNGIDIKQFTNVKPNKNLKLLAKKDEVIIFFPARLVNITTGAIAEQKNFILVQKALGEVVKKGISNFRLIAILNESVTGKMYHQSLKTIKQTINKYGLSDKVDFIESVTPEKMPPLYAASDIVCVPSLYETFGLVYIEAMASGKIAISSDTGGPKEYIYNGKNGYKVDPNDHKKLAEILIELLSNKNKILKISKESKKFVKKFSYQKMCQEIELVYDTIIR